MMKWLTVLEIFGKKPRVFIYNAQKGLGNIGSWDQGCGLSYYYKNYL